jgi:hypothetical protein
VVTLPSTAAFNRRVISCLLLLVALIVGHAAHAQLFVVPHEDMTSPVHEALTPASSQQTFLAQNNARGARSFCYYAH